MSPSRLHAVALAAALVAAPFAIATPAHAGTHPDCSAGPVARASGALNAPAVPFGEARLLGNDVIASTAELDLTISLNPLAWTATRSADNVVLANEAPNGLYVKRSAATAASPIPVNHAETVQLDRCAIRLRLFFDDGTTGVLVFRAAGEDTVSLSLVPDHPKSRSTGRVTAWGESLVTPADEHIYGLTERTVNSVDDSERHPAEVGSLDRKGELVRMYLTRSQSAYAPFYQSSRGYGIVVDGTMPGLYDIGATHTDRLRFEFELDPRAGAARWFVLGGRSSYDLNDAYSRLTGRPLLPPESVFTHWIGHDLYPSGKFATYEGVKMNALVADDLRHHAQYGIAPGIYHFDRPWAVGRDGFGMLRFDPTRFPNASKMLALMHRLGWRIEVWFSDWALDARGKRARRHHWLAPHSARELDLTNPAAVRALQGDVRQFLEGPEGQYVDGLYIDRTDDRVPSRTGDVYHDGRNGRQMRNAYPIAAQSALESVVVDERGADGWVAARAAYTGTAALAVTVGGVTLGRLPKASGAPASTPGPATDLGLRGVLVMMQQAAFMGIPYWGSDIGGSTAVADRDAFARWIEVGAASPIMRFHGQDPRAPWAMPTVPHQDQELAHIYKRYIELHDSLAPYLHELADDAHATGAPIVRPLVYNFADDAAAQNLIDEWQLGDDLLAAPVWRDGVRERTIHLPEGRWVDFWDRSRVLQGPVDITEQVPLDRLPLFVREGSQLLRLKIPA